MSIRGNLTIVARSVKLSDLCSPFVTPRLLYKAIYLKVICPRVLLLRPCHTQQSHARDVGITT